MRSDTCKKSGEVREIKGDSIIYTPASPADELPITGERAKFQVISAEILSINITQNQVWAMLPEEKIWQRGQHPCRFSIFLSSPIFSNITGCLHPEKAILRRENPNNNTSPTLPFSLYNNIFFKYFFFSFFSLAAHQELISTPSLLKSNKAMMNRYLSEDGTRPCVPIQGEQPQVGKSKS